MATLSGANLQNYVSDQYRAHALALAHNPDSPAAQQTTALQQQAESSKHQVSATNRQTAAINAQTDELIVQNITLNKIEGAMHVQNQHLGELVDIGREAVVKLDEIGQELRGIKAGVDQLVAIQSELLEREKIQDKVGEVVFVVERILKKYSQIEPKTEKDELDFYRTGCDIISSLKRSGFSTKFIRENQLKHSFADSIESINKELKNLHQQGHIKNYIAFVGKGFKQVSDEYEKQEAELLEQQSGIAGSKEKIEKLEGKQWKLKRTVILHFLIVPLAGTCIGTSLLSAVLQAVLGTAANGEMTETSEKIFVITLAAYIALTVLDVIYAILQLVVGNPKRLIQIKSIKNKLEKTNDSIRPLEEKLEKNSVVVVDFKIFNSALNLDFIAEEEFTDSSVNF